MASNTPRVCCYCTHARNNAGAWTCNRNPQQPRPTRPDYGCQHWQRQPGSDDDL